MSIEFGYVNARVRGMSSRLLGSDAYASALAAEDIRAFQTVFAQTPYAAAYEEAGARTKNALRAVDDALAEDFHATTRRMLEFDDGAPRAMIAALLRRYDLEDLKTVARAHHAGRRPDDLGEALTGAGDLRPAALEALVAAADLPAAAQALAITKHPLAGPFAKAARRYVEDRSLLAFEVALDQAYFASLLDEAFGSDRPESFRAHVRREIDAANVRTALKVHGRDVDVGSLFVPGGREIGRDAFERLAAEGLSAAGELGSRTFAALAEAEDLASAERAIREALDTAALRAARREPVGIAVVVRYLRAKEAEAAKLRLLARGAYYQLPRESLEKELGRA